MSSTATNAVAATASLAEDIRDIRPPIHIPHGWFWVYIAGTCIIAALAWCFWHRRAQSAKPRRADELALEQLERVRALMQLDSAYAFSIAVSEIVRHYIEERFQVRAAHRTTEEFLHDLLPEQHQLLAAHRPLLADFLEHCDLAKFARWELSLAEMEAMYESACAFVFLTGSPTPMRTELEPGY